MPFDDALGLVDRDFERYKQGVREGRLPPRRAPSSGGANVTTLLSKAATGENLSQNELSAVISALQKQQASASSAPPPSRPKEQGRQNYSQIFFVLSTPACLSPFLCLECCVFHHLLSSNIVYIWPGDMYMLLIY